MNFPQWPACSACRSPNLARPAAADPGPTTCDRLFALGSPRAAAAVLTGANALCLLLVVFGNVTDFATGRQFVRHVLAMDATFHGRALMWGSVTSRVLQDAAYVAVIAWEALSAVVLTAGTFRLAPPRPSRARLCPSAGGDCRPAGGGVWPLGWARRSLPSVGGGA
ncbi:DUF2165 domain-containing protein [Kitasatospora cathayae]|uniref:DUF2165 domain-containing protein n=1 Tax=Kitasatospora cathayae TaxID=3004092 RepID=UPI0032AF2678